MRSRDKLGLLIGLISIITIVYLIKGLPVVKNGKDAGLSRTIQPSHTIVTNDMDIMDDARKAVEVIDMEKRDNLMRSSEVDDSARAVVSVTKIKVDHLVKKEQEKGYYTVESGDSLGIIAEKVYGKGNVGEKIDKIYEANKDTLESPNVVVVGQKLRIPPLSSDSDEGNPLSRFIANTFGGKSNVATLSSSHNKFSEYKVKPGDTLWKIASKELSDSTYYKEILSLNKDVLKDEDELKVGMIIKLPRK